MQRSRGFSLIELVAVLVVLAVLGGIALPKYLSMGDRAKATADEAALAGMNTALKTAHTAHRVGEAPEAMWIKDVDQIATAMETSKIPEGWSIESDELFDQRGNAYVLIAETADSAAWIRLATDDDLAANEDEPSDAGNGGWPAPRDMAYIQSLAAAEIPGANLSPTEFAMLTPEQLAQLTNEQLAAFSAEHIAAMTPSQITALSNAQFETVVQFITVSQIAFASPEQVAMLSAEAYSQLSEAHRGAMTPEQVAERAVSENARAQSFNGMRSLAVGAIKYLLPSQIALITSDYAMSLMSADRRAAFTLAQVQTLNTANVSLGYLTEAQRGQLTTAQMAAIRVGDVRYAPVNRMGDIPAATIAQINSDYAMSLVSSDRRAAFSAAQVQALNTALVSLGYLTEGQRGQLTTNQMASIRVGDVRHVPVDRLGDVPPATIAQINSDYAMSLVSSDRRAAFSAAQVQALNTALVSLGYLTEGQRGQLTTNQMAAIRVGDVQHVPVDRMGDIPPATIAGITSDYAMSLVSSDRRAAFSASQIQALNTSVVSLGYLTADQRGQLTANQMAAIRVGDVQHVPVDRLGDVPPATIGQIDSDYAMSLVSAERRAAFSAGQVQAIDTTVVSLGYLTSTQRGQLTSGQMAAIRAGDVQHASASRIGEVPSATINQINSAYAWSLVPTGNVQRLTQEQVTGLSAEAYSWISTRLTDAQRAWRGS